MGLTLSGLGRSLAFHLFATIFPCAAFPLVKGSDRPLILASRLHPRLQLKVQSGFWLVLPEKSDAGFPVVNPAYDHRRSLYFDLCDRTLWSYMYNDI